MSKSSKSRTIVISIDAINSKDLELIKKLPVFEDFIKNGSLIKEMHSIYPTLTYPCHTSMITGELPAIHGIYNNELLQPQNGTSPEWHWYSKAIQCDTLFTKATQKGLSVTTILWPVTAGLKIKNNMPEIWSVTNESMTKLMLKNGTFSTVLASLKYKSQLRGLEQPYLDDFSTDLLIDRILHAPTDLFFLHLTDLDTERHYKGPFYPDLNYNLGRMNKRIEKIINATKKANIYENTNFFLVGDHGTNGFKKTILLNHHFRKKGWLTLGTHGKIESFQLFAQHAGGSCHIHIPENSIFTPENVLQILTDFNDTYLCFKHIYDKKQALEQFGLSGPFHFVVEAADGFTFRNDFTKSDICLGSPNHYKGDHGCLPTHPDQKTLLIAKGPAIKHGTILSSASILDIGPTIGYLHQMDFKNTQGKPLLDILNH